MAHCTSGCVSTQRAAALLISAAVFLLTAHHVWSKTIHSFAGPYLAYVHTFTPCPSDGNVRLLARGSHYNPLKPFERQRVTGNVTLLRPFGDDVLSRVNMAVWANNQWKENAFVMMFPHLGCGAVRDHIPDLYRILAKATGAPTGRNAPCIFPKGQYSFQDEPINWTFPKFPVMPYGRYRYSLTSRVSVKDPKPCLCLDVDCEVIPKPS